MTTNNSINASQTGIQKYDGTSSWTGITVTQHSPLVGAASNGITSIGPLTNGQLLIGNTGSDPSAATLTAGSGVSITNGSGSITISTAGGGFSWTTVTGTTQSMAVENGYVANNASLITFTLPSSASVGDSIQIIGLGAGGFSLVLNSGQLIRFGNQVTTTSSGSISSTNQYDSLNIVCIVTNTTWSVRAAQGNLSVV